jgi:hypothetical protein
VAAAVATMEIDYDVEVSIDWIQGHQGLKLQWEITLVSGNKFVVTEFQSRYHGHEASPALLLPHVSCIS